MVSSVLLCWITIHVLSSELEKRQEEVRITVFLNVFSFTKVNHTNKKAKVCKSWRPTCHVTIDELGVYRPAAVHIDVIMSWCVTSVFVRLTWLLIYCCDRQHVEFIKGRATSLLPHLHHSTIMFKTQVMAAYSCGRWLLGSHCRSNYSRRCSMTAHIYRRVRSGWESTWETWRDRHKDRQTGRKEICQKFPLKSSKKILVSDRHTLLFSRCWKELSQEISLSFKQECGEILTNFEIQSIYITFNILFVADTFLWFTERHN